MRPRKRGARKARKASKLGPSKRPPFPIGDKRATNTTASRTQSMWGRNPKFRHRINSYRRRTSIKAYHHYRTAGGGPLSSHVTRMPGYVRTPSTTGTRRAINRKRARRDTRGRFR